VDLAVAWTLSLPPSFGPIDPTEKKIHAGPQLEHVFLACRLRVISFMKFDSFHKGPLAFDNNIFGSFVKYMQSRDCAKSSKVTSHLGQNVKLALWL
jgi:hypothetical protein